MQANLLEGKNAVVTGGAAGIGRAIAQAFAAEGAGVAICDLDYDGAKKAAEEIRSDGAIAKAYETDVSDWESVMQVAEKALEDFGVIDILVNNAGITRDNLIIRMSDEEWNDVLDVNLKGVFNFTKAFVPGMLRRRSGKIISIASVVGIMGNAGQANYAASKAGIIGFTKSLARELAPRRINVNAIAPGFIKTGMTEVLGEEQKSALSERIPLSRLGEPEDVARSALFLASELSDYITGQVLVVDGGMVM
ncbi:3-oxoacyl-[acyl-carrier-protein] reductase [bacterium]|nr:3-oxoacyl-[acyl-carrier-protein] reductase [bacterium]